MANEQNLRPFTSDQSREEAVKNGQKGGIASGKARRERKTLAETLRAELEKDAGSGLTKQEYLVAKCLADLADKKGKVFPKDLKTLSEVLGELKQNVKVELPEIPKELDKQGAIDFLAQMNK